MISSVIAVSVLCLQFSFSYGAPRNQGVGAFAYQDSAGNRYGGTYGLRDGAVFNFDNDVTTYGPNPFTDFQDIDSFFPEYFRNLENILQHNSKVKRVYASPLKRFIGPTKTFGARSAFAKNSENQRLALDAARKAFDVTSHQGGQFPSFAGDRFGGVPPSFGFPAVDFEMPEFGPNNNLYGFHHNSAFAGGAVGPGYRHQMVNINPVNPQMPNVDVTQFSDAAPRGAPGGYYSVSSSSFASSSNVNGKEKTQRGGETVVNENGKITKYSVHS